MSSSASQLPIIKRQKRRKLDDDTPWALLMLAPNIIGFLMFMVLPIFATLFFSFTEYDLIGTPKFVGLENYKTLLSDPIIGITLKNTLYFTVLTVPIGMVFALLLAVMLDQEIGMKRFYRGAYFLPSITSMVAVSIVWQWIFNPEFGLLNYVLSFFGIKGIAWLSSSSTSLISIAIVNIWKNVGYNMMLFLAGLQGISTSYYEASELDGANRWQQFRYVTLPMLSPTTFFIFIMSIISSFQVFDSVVLMTKGGPGRSSSVLVHYLYQNAFQYFSMGYACAIAYLLFFIVLLVTLFNMRFEKKIKEIF
ncbi:MAG: sugar ABC transporter permease [Bacillota bacterium]|nr:sugar ABC transporter permease [Bacillota bacterium]